MNKTTLIRIIDCTPDDVEKNLTMDELIDYHGGLLTCRYSGGRCYVERGSAARLQPIGYVGRKWGSNVKVWRR